MTQYDSGATHEVINQVPPLVDTNVFTQDRFLYDAVMRYGGQWARSHLESFGARFGSQEVLLWAEQANRFEPQLRTHDRTGNRIDEVDFHPAWHNLMALSTEYGMHNLPWASNNESTHTVRAAMMFMAYQTEAGHCCPISMTYSAVPALRREPALRDVWEPLICSNQYDGKLNISGTKTSAIFGMGMTEKQGGSDVRANSTRAEPIPGQDGMYLLTGHKWFCSAPMSDGFLMLAQTASGLSCFLVPRILPDGKRNRFHIQRLKEKLGNKSNASSEIELRNTIGYRVGEEGRGVPTIIEMVNHTRLDCAIGSASLMRQSTLQAMHHAKYRSAFGGLLVEKPLMQAVLADLALESEAGLLLTMRLANSYDSASSQESEDSFRRITSAVSKYWLCKRASNVVSEALECMGGNGYVEESVMPRLFRESPLNSIWEGAGNVICLDVMRALAKEPQSIDSLAAEFDTVKGYSSRYDRYVASVVKDLKATQVALTRGTSASRLRAERKARMLVEKTALALQASLMIQYSSVEASKAFVSSRLGSNHGYLFGTLSSGIRVTRILNRYLETV